MNWAKRAFLWLKHYIFSDTLHGTHSPFVYHFLQDIVYKPHTNHLNKIDALILRMASMPSIDHVLFLGNSLKNPLIPEEINKPVFSDITSIHNSKAGLIILDTDINTIEIINTYDAFRNQFDNNSIFMVLGIRYTEERLLCWEELCKDSKNIISIDFFHFGILFFEQAKPKEHFNIYF